MLLFPPPWQAEQSFICALTAGCACVADKAPGEAS